MSGAMTIKIFTRAIYHSDVFGELINKIIGAGDRCRTGDVQLGNFLLKSIFSFFRAITKAIFSAPETFF